MVVKTSSRTMLIVCLVLICLVAVSIVVGITYAFAKSLHPHGMSPRADARLVNPLPPTPQGPGASDESQ